MKLTAINPDRYEVMRHAMVASQLRTNAVSDPRVVAAMARVPRETFLPVEAQAIAYRDTALPLGGGRFQNVPIATGRLLTEAYLLPSDKVLLIGAAGGYTAAVLAELTMSVVAVESDAALAALAREALADHAADHARVTLIEGALEAGHPDGAPYDVLMIDGSVEQVPDSLIAQLRDGGRVVSGIADRGITRLAAGRKTEGGFALLDFADIDCVPLPGFARAKTFTF
ncbi:protein-L-isoaspartate O-methyltransferase [Sphingomonas sp. So64.6b]|uniref:protein-L-isoaspartate O-methyltransferase family protein n=1 Tax=Sphingomonas sp. So64.6b TaxID=2997354 RepID=UPI001603B780|nr:rRNA adenine N-6-methyltransferase family protein [Sphingomonas sp. So64.6b]QNA83608.1 protein-L-isoaspartate O-methyltransferase [Sphingomonas sp. So64.6b]